MKYLIVSVVLSLILNAYAGPNYNYCSVGNFNDSDSYSFIVLNETVSNKDNVVEVVANNLSLDEAIRRVQVECARWTQVMEYDCEIENNPDLDSYRVFRGTNYISPSLSEKDAEKVLSKLKEEGLCKS